VALLWIGLRQRVATRIYLVSAPASSRSRLLGLREPEQGNSDGD
jgi:hypothetical protein